jgi:hypothetical protein
MQLAILVNEIAKGSQSKCLTQRRLNTTIIGELIERGMQF